MQNLFQDFKPLSLSDWKKSIEKSLKGKTFDQLSEPDQNGIPIHPVYSAENSVKTSGPLFSHHNWNICTEFRVKDEKQVNALAVAELNGGADALHFLVPPAKNAHTLLNEILIEHIRTNITLSAFDKNFVVDFFKVICDRKLEAGALNGFFSYDQLFVKPSESFLKEWKEFVSQKLFSETNYTPFCFDVSHYHEAGSNSVTELAFSILQINEYLNFAEQSKMSLGNKDIVVCVAVGNNFFESVSKLRALRKLLNYLLKQYGHKNQVFIHCRNTHVNKSTLDIHNNLLRSTTEGMAAVVGGANSLTLFPYNDVAKENDPEALRWARNQQIIFKEEAHLDKVADMGAGSYFIESLTQKLSENAWKIFQAIEAEGGFIECVTNGFIPELISTMATNQKMEFEGGKKILVGVNKFRNEKEKVLNRLAEKVSSLNIVLSEEVENSVKVNKGEHA